MNIKWNNSKIHILFCQKDFFLSQQGFFIIYF
jgi:hypothetical protein